MALGGIAADREVAVREPNYDKAKIAPYTLEDPLTFLDGRKVTKENWSARRKEILGIFAKEMYGAEPPPPEALVTELVDEKGDAAAGFAIRRQYRMWFKADKSGPAINWIVWIPRYAKKPVPVISFLNYQGNHELVLDADIPLPDVWLRSQSDGSVESNRPVERRRGAWQNPNNNAVLPLGDILARGYAVMSACYGEISRDPSPGEDAYDRVFTLWGARDPKRTDDITALGAWGWALCRGLDLAERIPEIDAKRSVVTGYSRLGKAALIAAARDERFAVCVPNQTGGGGAPLAKRDYGENISTENRKFPHWYCRAYAKYAGDPAKLLTFDQHLFLACVAPRALLIEGFDEPWFDTEGEYLAVKAASPVWELLTGGGMPKVAWPDDFDTSAIGARLGYVRRSGSHGLAAVDWKWLLDFVDGALGGVAAKRFDTIMSDGRTTNGLPLRAFSTLRLPATRENWPAHRAMLSRSRDCFDEIWFSACNFKSLAENAEKAKWLGEVAREVREMGYVASLEFELTIGNTDTPECKRLPFKDWTGFTGPEGWEGVNCNCPRDPRFHAYFREQLKYYGAWAPTVIWLDDDVRIDNHGNNSTGCFCARCLAVFSKAEGRTWTREALVAAMAKDAALAARWREHCFKGLGEFAYAFCRAAKEFSPTSRLGLQYPWADEGQLHIIKAMVKAAGEPIEMRPGCCSYCDRDPFAQIDKTYRMQCQVKMLLAHPDWCSRLCPEIETYPRTFTTRTARSLGFEALTHLASGLDSLTWYIAGNAEQPELYEGTTFRAPRENLALYREYVRRNAGAEQVGFGAPEWETFGKDMKGFAAVNGSSTIPYAFGAGRKLGTVLWREDQVADADEAALKKMLSGAVLATRAVASALVARGLVPSDAAKLPSEKYTDSTAYFPKAVKTAEGGQLVVYPSLDPMGATVKTLLEYAHLADAACGGRFPVLFEDPALAVVLPRVFANGSFASAVIVNTRIEEQAPVRLRLRGFGSDAALWYPLWSGSPVRLPVVREAKTGDALVTLPAVGAWSGGFLVP